MKKILTIIITLNVFAFYAYPQATSSATVTATVVQPVTNEPINISKTVNSDYGNVTIMLAGSVSVSPVGDPSKAGNIKLPVTTGTLTIASFYNSGESGYTYTITVPREPVTITNGSKKLKINSFESDPTLHAEPGMTAGIYVSVTPFNVIVNYN